MYIVAICFKNRKKIESDCYTLYLATFIYIYKNYYFFLKIDNNIIVITILTASPAPIIK